MSIANLFGNGPDIALNQERIVWLSITGTSRLECSKEYNVVLCWILRLYYSKEEKIWPIDNVLKDVNSCH